jgi:hypothetical protein
MQYFSSTLNVRVRATWGIPDAMAVVVDVVACCRMTVAKLDKRARRSVVGHQDDKPLNMALNQIMLVKYVSDLLTKPQNAVFDGDVQ